MLAVLIASCKSKSDNKEQKISAADTTIESINASIKSDPKNPALYVKRADIYLSKGKSINAYNDMATAVLLDSSNYDYQFKFSEVAFVAGKSRQTKV